MKSGFDKQRWVNALSHFHPFSFLSLLTPFLPPSSFLPTMLSLSPFTVVDRPASFVSAPTPSQHFKEAVPSITAVSSYPDHIKIWSSIFIYISICMSMCLKFSIVWFCLVSVPVMLFKRNAIPVNCVTADVHSCIQKWELERTLLCFPYSFLSVSLVIWWWCCLEINTDTILSNLSLILLIYQR